MKIGILTQPLRTNYGGILQNYALQQVLESIGHNPITLDYDTRYTPLQWFLGRAKALIFRTRHTAEFPKHFRSGQENLNAFVHKYIKTTNPKIGLPLKLFAVSLDAIIVGSDQVWRPTCNVPVEWLYEMFLGSITDLPLRKIAYSASFGSDQWEYSPEQESRCKKLIKLFSAVSVREDSGVALCRDHFGREALWTLDPTLLLTGNQYTNIIASNPFTTETLFSYILDSDEHKNAMIDNFAKGNSLVSFVRGANDDIRRTDSIEQWLAWIKNSSYVITDSFHGMVFSILFHRPFAVVTGSWRGNARFESLLGLCGLSDRVVKDEAHLPGFEIDWKMVDEKLHAARTHSIKYLRKSLSS